MFRWHKALLDGGVDSRILCLHKSSADERSVGYPQDWRSERARSGHVVQKYYLDANRSEFSDIYFSHPFGISDVANHPWVLEADIVNVHWNSGFLHLADLYALKESGKRIVVTAHDFWAATGGCHYPSKCRGYLAKCDPCPMLKKDPFHFVSSCHSAKLAVTAEVVDQIICPSHWLAKEFSQIPAWSAVPIEVVPYCFNAPKLELVEKERARQELGWSQEERVVIFCADHAKESRKGLADFLRLADLIEADEQLRRIDGSLRFVSLGKGTEQIHRDQGIKLEGKGFVADPEQVRRFFLGADLQLYLGKEDNLPNALLEAISCGTPVVAFKVGGVGEIVVEGISGKLIEAGDVREAALQTASLLRDPQEIKRLALEARRFFDQTFAPAGISAKLSAIYGGLLQQTRLPLARAAVKSKPNLEIDVRVLCRSLMLYNKDAQTELEKLRAIAGHLSTLQKELDALRDTAARTQNDLLAARESLATLQKELSATKEELSATKEELSATKEERNFARNELAAEHAKPMVRIGFERLMARIKRLTRT
jgi:glycosyltransferase involved in cell wall biosynthesis